MSIIAVEGLPIRISLSQVVKMLAKSIQGYFEALNFVNTDRNTLKTCYLQISEKLDAAEVVERINNMAHGKKKNLLRAFIPESVPNMPIAVNRTSLPLKLQKKMGVYRDSTPTKVLSVAHVEIMTELQYKYTGLYKLSSDGSHTLLEAIGMTVYDRLKQLMASSDEESSTAFLLTTRYRKVHPHFGDFQLILGTLHRLQDAAGAPRTQLQESELTVTPRDLSAVDDVPYTKAQEAVSKYIDRITKKLQAHVASYDLTASPEDSKEEAARKEVQTQLSKMMFYLPSIMKQVATAHFSEDARKSRYQRMRMYGEPYLPGKEFTVPLLRRWSAQRVSRWKSMYNLLAFDVPLGNYTKIMALDGTSLGGSKLVFRTSGANIYRVKLTRKKVGADTSEMEDDEEGDYEMEQ